MEYLHSQAEILRNALIVLNQGVLPSDLPATNKPSWNSLWPISVGTEPKDPDNSVTLFDTSGKIQGRIQFTGDMCEFPGIQVRVRANDYNAGYVKISTLRLKLDREIKNTNVVFGSATYKIHAVTRTSLPLSDGYERVFAQPPLTKRRVFSFNAIMSISRVS